MIKRTQHIKSQFHKADRYFDAKHKETYLVNTWWFIFIPIYRNYTILKYTCN